MKALTFLPLLLSVTLCVTENPNTSYRLNRVKFLANTTANCELLDPLLIEKIASYQETANKIVNFLKNEFKGETYKELEKFVDLYPYRTSGSKELENSIDYMINRMEELGLENVRGEQVLVPHWVRGEETAELLQPFKKSLPILGLGTSVGTSEAGITAPVLVVRTYEELVVNKDQARGKIVVYNQGWVNNSYSPTVNYRINGAAWAAEFGAVATLIESVAPFSLNTPHTGLQFYNESFPCIPVACITKEDAAMLYRLQEKSNGTEITIHLKMLDFNMPETMSRNVIGEIPGQTTPTEFVAVSGHIDGWDVGQGAMDDAGGVMVSVMALAALKKLGLTPNRTLQAILWTAEEMNLWGVQGFAKQHKDILEQYSVAFESDFGTFKPKGLDFAGSDEAGCIIIEVLKLVTSSIGEMEYNQMFRVSSDITVLQDMCVPGLNLNNENDEYFWYHHSAADTMIMMNSDDLDMDTALFAVAAYVLADIPIMLPRDPTCNSK